VNSQVHPARLCANASHRASTQGQRQRDDPACRNPEADLAPGVTRFEAAPGHHAKRNFTAGNFTTISFTTLRAIRGMRNF